MEIEHLIVTYKVDEKLWKKHKVDSNEIANALKHNPHTPTFDMSRKHGYRAFVKLTLNDSRVFIAWLQPVYAEFGVWKLITAYEIKE